MTQHHTIVFLTQWSSHQLPSDAGDALEGVGMESDVAGLDWGVNLVHHWGQIINVLFTKLLEKKDETLISIMLRRR